jgi:hypothetical protein
MENNIERALRNAKQIEVPGSTIDRVENVLRNLEHRKDITYMKPKYKKTVFIAAVIAISLLMFGTAALAYTGVLSGVFSAITGGTEDVNAHFTTDTRRAIVDNEHVAVHELPPASISDDGSKLELIAYFADKNEIWFNFILSNADIPDHWDADTDQLLPCFFSLEFVQNDGTVSRFERVIDENSERNTFPGGYTIFDRERNLVGHRFDDDCQTFGYSTTVSLRDDGSLDITLIVEIFSRNATIGDKAYLQIGNFMFNSVRLPDDTILGVEDTLEMYHDRWITHRTILNGIYEFEIEIESRFTEAAAFLRYVPENTEEAAQLGINIHSVIVTPTATKVEVTIDTSKSNLMNPDYFVIHESIDLGNGNPPIAPESLSGQDIFDMRLMNTKIYAVSDTKEYSHFMGVNGRHEENIIEGWWAFSSMYFDAPENLTLVFDTHVFGGEYTGGEVRIPLVLVR